MRLFSQHSAAATADAVDLNGTDETGSSGGVLEAVLDLVEDAMTDEPQVTGEIAVDVEPETDAEPDVVDEPLTAESAAGGVASLLGRLFAKSSAQTDEEHHEPFVEDETLFEPTEIHDNDDIADAAEIEFGAAPDIEGDHANASTDEAEGPRTRRRWWRSKRSATAGSADEDVDAPEALPLDDPPGDADRLTIGEAEPGDDTFTDLGVLGSLATVDNVMNDDGAEESVEPAARPTRRRRRKGRRGSPVELDYRTRGRVDDADEEVAAPEPDSEIELAVAQLTDEDLGLNEPPTLSRKERKAAKKKEPRGRRARKKANEQADLDLGSRVAALAATVPDGVKTLDYPKLYQNDDLLQMGLVARRRELAALHPKDDLDTLTAASVLGSVLRMDEELYSLKPRHILRKIVLLALAAGGGWFLAQKIKKDKEAEREAEAIAHLDRQFADGPRPPIPD